MKYHHTIHGCPGHDDENSLSGECYSLASKITPETVRKAAEKSNEEQRKMMTSPNLKTEPWADEMDNLFGDDSNKLSTGQALLQFKKGTNYYLVKDFITQLLSKQRLDIIELFKKYGLECEEDIYQVDYSQSELICRIFTTLKDKIR